MQATVKVTRNGQVSIPLAVREVMEIEEGDLIVIDVVEVAKKASKSSHRSPHEAPVTA